MKNIIILCLVGSFAGVRQVIEKAKEQEIIEVRRTFEELEEKTVRLKPVELPVFSYPSERKSKGQKKRDASARRRKGW